MMEGGRGLEAVPDKPRYAECPTCHGEGVETWSNGERGYCGLLHEETARCSGCNGSGEIYVGPSGEPEDYLEDEE